MGIVGQGALVGLVLFKNRASLSEIAHFLSCRKGVGR